MFWGIHRGEELWVSPEQFEHMREIKNASARQSAPTPEAKARRLIREKLRRQTPEAKLKSNLYQRKMRHIYSPRYKAKRRAYKKMRRLTDPLFRLKATLGTRIRLGFKRQCVRKQSKCIELLGCTFEEFKNWIAAQFEEGMTFESYGFDTWHIDHVIPIGAFDLSDPIAAKHAFNFRNCRPAWGKPNLQKNDRLDMALIGKHNLHDWLCYTKDAPA